MATQPNRIDAMFAAKKAAGQSSSIFYVTAGYPDFDTTRRVAAALAESGADLLEIGIPFSDPIADGPTIQKASQIALENGATVKGVLGLVKDLRAANELPLVLFTAFNPVLRYGLAEFVKDAKSAGADGLLVPDLPPEEAGDLIALCGPANLRLIFLIAPTTTPERRALIERNASGFIYYISLRGVTGARESLPDDLFTNVRAIKSETDIPVAVGFGISKPDHASQVAGEADGIVVGSALINVITKYAGTPALEDEVRKFASELTGAIAR